MTESIFSLIFPLHGLQKLANTSEIIPTQKIKSSFGKSLIIFGENTM